jgi:hypothetical protein
MLGLLGLSLARDEGIELNLLGLSFGIDVARPALKLPFIGRLGLANNRAALVTAEPPLKPKQME